MDNSLISKYTDGISLFSDNIEVEKIKFIEKINGDIEVALTVNDFILIKDCSDYEIFFSLFSNSSTFEIKYMDDSKFEMIFLFEGGVFYQ